MGIIAADTNHVEREWNEFNLNTMENLMEGIRNPVRHIRKGDVEATIWFFDPKKGKRGWYYVTVSRLYRDGTFERDGTYFRFDDLIDLERVSWRARLWIWFWGGWRSQSRWKR